MDTHTVLSIIFCLRQLQKIFGAEVTVGHFREWGYGNWLVTAVAAMELIGAILLLFPVTATSGALLLSLVMAGATYTLISHEVWRTSAITIATLLLLLGLGYMRWNQSWILALFKMGGAA